MCNLFQNIEESSFLYHFLAFVFFIPMCHKQHHYQLLCYNSILHNMVSLSAADTLVSKAFSTELGVSEIESIPMSRESKRVCRKERDLVTFGALCGGPLCMPYVLQFLTMHLFYLGIQLKVSASFKRE